LKKIKRIIIHCSDSEWGNSAVIKSWHLARGFKDIGYHYVINNGYKSSVSEYNTELDGLIEAGRSLDNDVEMDFDEVGAHTKDWNSDSIGICLIGVKEFSFKQFDSLIILCSMWHRLIPELEIKGHYDYTTEKTCPNFRVDNLERIILNKETLTLSISDILMSSTFPLKKETVFL
jgi:hypothetical protein